MYDIRTMQVIDQINRNDLGNQYWGVITSPINTSHYFGTVEKDTLSMCIYLYNDTRNEVPPIYIEPDARYMVDDYTEVLIYNASKNF